MSFTGLVTSDYVKRARLDDRLKESLIDFTASDFLTLRQNLVNYIKASYPLDYNYFVESDLGVMLIEIVAAMGHIMSYKADYLANENFLRTAKKRTSVQKLLDLIGIRLQGPTSAAANGKLTLETPRDSSKIIKIPLESRAFTVTSPEDSTQLTYTIYKSTPNGLVDLDDSSGDLEFPYDPSIGSGSSIITNIILLEGNLVQQTGNFFDTDAIKSITLEQFPIIENSIQVVVGGESYRQVDNIFYASGPDDKAFQYVTDERYAGVVFFGDNLLGKSPAPGSAFTVFYRVGGGTRGNLAKGIINAPLIYTENTINSEVQTSKQGNIENVSLATGGTNAQTLENARRYGPLYFRSQDRLVTINDYIAFANMFRSTYGSVGKATVTTRKAFSSANIIDLYILEKANDTQFKRATPEFKKQLLEAIEPKKMITDEVIVVDGLIRTIDPVLTVKCDSKYKPKEAEIKLKVRDKILEFFNIDNAEFGKPFTQQELNTKLFEIEEVRYSTVDNLPNVIHTQFNEVIQLNNFNILMVFE